MILHCVIEEGATYLALCKGGGEGDSVEKTHDVVVSMPWTGNVVALVQLPWFSADAATTSSLRELPWERSVIWRMQALICQ